MGATKKSKAGKKIWKGRNEQTVSSTSTDINIHTNVISMDVDIENSTNVQSQSNHFEHSGALENTPMDFEVFREDGIVAGPSNTFVKTQMNENPLGWPTMESPLPQLVVEYKSPEKIPKEGLPYGRRLFMLDSVDDAMNAAIKHSRICTNAHVYTAKEIRNGLESMFVVECTGCTREFRYQNDKGSKTTNANEAAVWAPNATGLGFRAMKLIFSCFDAPFMSKEKYYKQESNFQTQLEESWLKLLKENGEEEKRLAIELGQVTKNGIPYTSVYGDGQWGKRCYNQTGNSLSGGAALFGLLTNKPLWVGVRNKFCIICSRHSKKETPVPQHTCFKNWEGSSTSMEKDIVVEGFKSSMEIHGLVYKAYVGDGDSSVFLHIKLTYQGIDKYLIVEKIECKNHAIRRMNVNLRNLLKQTCYPCLHRNIFADIAYRIGRLCVYIIEIHKTSRPKTDSKTLKEDLLKVLPHAFGLHKDCSPLFCDEGKTIIPEKFKKSGKAPPKAIEFMKQKYEAVKNSNLYKAVQNLIFRLASMSVSLIHGITSNIVESFNATINKFLQGKRINYYGRGSYKRKLMASTFAFQFGCGWMAKAYKYMHQSSPSVFWKKTLEEGLTEKRRVKTQKPRKRLAFTKPRDAYFSKSRTATGDADYGNNAASPDLSTEDLQKEIQRIHEERLLKVQGKEKEIERATVGQFENPVYKEYRKGCISASVMGKIVKTRDSTPNVGLLDLLIAPKHFSTEATNWGTQNEWRALELYNARRLAEGKSKAEKSGLWISKMHPRIVASPDGVLNIHCINDEEHETRPYEGLGCVEIKCPFVEKDMYPSDVCNRKSGAFICKKNDGSLALKESHDYMYQVLTQIYVTDARFCDFVIWTQGPIDITEQPINPAGFIEIVRIERTNKTDELWAKISNLAVRFIEQELYPELADSRFERNMGYRQPQYRLDAIEAKSKEDEKKREKKQNQAGSSSANPPANKQSKRCKSLTASNEQSEKASPPSSIAKAKTIKRKVSLKTSTARNSKIDLSAESLKKVQKKAIARERKTKTTQQKSSTAAKSSSGRYCTRSTTVTKAKEHNSLNLKCNSEANKENQSIVEKSDRKLRSKRN